MNQNNNDLHRDASKEMEGGLPIEASDDDQIAVIPSMPVMPVEEGN